MQRTIRHTGRDWLNPAIATFTDAARREVAAMRAAYPNLTPGYELADRAFIASLDGSPVAIQIISSTIAWAAPVIDTGVKGTDHLQFVLR